MEQEALLALAAQLAALVEAYDRVVRDQQAMETAAESFSSLLQVGGRGWHARDLLPSEAGGRAACWTAGSLLAA